MTSSASNGAHSLRLSEALPLVNTRSTVRLTFGRTEGTNVPHEFPRLCSHLAGGAEESTVPVFQKTTSRNRGYGFGRRGTNRRTHGKAGPGFPVRLPKCMTGTAHRGPGRPRPHGAARSHQERKLVVRFKERLHAEPCESRLRGLHPAKRTIAAARYPGTTATRIPDRRSRGSHLYAD